MSQAARRRATLEEFWAIPEGVRFHELIAGELIEKAAPSGEHGSAQSSLVGALYTAFHRPALAGGLGGWRLAMGVEIRLDHGVIVRPDVVGWRRERCPERPVGMPVTIKPDWSCEVVSPSNATDDTVKKLRLFHQVAVLHYWLVDPRDATLTVMRWSADGYVTVVRAERGERVRPEPFDAIELAVGALFGDAPE
jgi:Uma2 family endonuclease